LPADIHRLGLIGFPLGHSASPALFARFFAQESSLWSYELFPMEQVDGLRAWLLTQPEIVGLNVTIPHKQAVIPHLDALHESARQTGAVNCIRITRRPDLHLEGFNTDTTGFAAMLDAFRLESNTSALVLGTGGASLAVQFVLRQRGIPFLCVGRNRNKADLVYEELSPQVVAKNHLLIQTTPLGMEGPWAGRMPVLAYDAIGPQHVCLDLVYKPANTPFLDICNKQGATTLGGMLMLEAQAKAAWEIFRT
jgi:shikimate dehydrogenase